MSIFKIGIEPADYNNGKMISPACKAYMQNLEELYNKIEDYMMQRVEDQKWIQIMLSRFAFI